MADVAVATTDSFASKLSGANVDDTMVMAGGLHLTAGTGTSRNTINKRVTIRAAAASYPSWTGRFVSNGLGHNLADWPTQWRGGWSFPTNAVVVNGMLFNGRMTGGPGSVDLTASSLVFNDCGFTDEFRYIMVHVMSAASNVVFNRCRFWNIGSRADHDHPIYWEDTTTTLGRCAVYDSIFYNHTGWAMHCYPTGDGVLYKRCLVYRGNGAGVFSAEGGLSSTGCEFDECLLVDAQGYGVGGFEDGNHPSYLVQNLGAGSGTVRNTMAVNNSPGPGVLGTIQSTSFITKVNVLEVGTPLWAAGSNPMATGDFRLDPNPSNPALGYGPTYIQPSGSTVDTSGSNLSIALLSGRTSKRTIGSHSSIAVPSRGLTAVHFANDPDRVSP